jgi:O-antigen/teichoic acid export membrane protein
MPDLNRLYSASAFFFTLLVFTIIVLRQKRCDRADMGVLAGTFIAGGNIPVAFFFCYYAFNPDPWEVISKTKLAGCEKFLSFAGAMMMFLSLSTIWTNIKSVYKIPSDTRS